MKHTKLRTQFTASIAMTGSYYLIKILLQIKFAEEVEWFLKQETKSLYAKLPCCFSA